jgi:hypothetical protein
MNASKAGLTKLILPAFQGEFIFVRFGKLSPFRKSDKVVLASPARRQDGVKMRVANGMIRKD